MSVKQVPYSSPAAMKLRHRDGTKPWEVHPAEVESLGVLKPDDPLYAEWLKAKKLLAQLEGRDEQA